MPWFVICHNPERPEDTSFVTDYDGECEAFENTTVFPNEKAAEDWISDREKSVPIYDYRAIEL